MTTASAYAPETRALPMDAPVRGHDFCACARGREGLRWFQEGQKALPALLRMIGEHAPCSACDARGVLWYIGWTDADGHVQDAGRCIGAVPGGVATWWRAVMFSPPWHYGDDYARIVELSAMAPLGG